MTHELLSGSPKLDLGLVGRINELCDCYRDQNGRLSSPGLHRESIMRGLHQGKPCDYFDDVTTKTRYQKENTEMRRKWLENGKHQI